MRNTYVNENGELCPGADDRIIEFAEKLVEALTDYLDDPEERAVMNKYPEEFSHALINLMPQYIWETLTGKNLAAEEFKVFSINLLKEMQG